MLTYSYLFYCSLSIMTSKMPFSFPSLDTETTVQVIEAYSLTSIQKNTALLLFEVSVLN